MWEQGAHSPQLDSTLGAGPENFASTQAWLRCEYHRQLCAHCQRISIEDLEVFHPYLRVTSRLAAEIHKLCKVMTFTDVARHFQLDWKKVNAIKRKAYGLRASATLR